jgi:DNA-directed RNA polymerase subunit H
MTSRIISDLFNARKNILKHLATQKYQVQDYENFSINEVNAMYINNQLDLVVEKTDLSTQHKRKIYVRFYLSKTIKQDMIQEIVDDLFHTDDNILTPNDTLVMVCNEDMNDTTKMFLNHIWETDGIFIVIHSLKRLQFNILEHEMVPTHEVLEKEEMQNIKKTFNVMDDAHFPTISRFDPVAQAIFIRPGQLCRITRPSKTSIESHYYRVCDLLVTK